MYLQSFILHVQRLNVASGCLLRMEDEEQRARIDHLTELNNQLNTAPKVVCIRR